MEFEGRARVVSELNIAPLIDVVFLLLLFFMLTSAFSHDEGLELVLPGSSTAEPLTKKSIEVAVFGSGAISVEGQEITLSQLGKRLSSEGQDSEVLIRSESGVNVQRLVTVMDTIRQSGVSDISLAAEREE